MAYTVQISSTAQRLARKLPKDVRRAIVLHAKKLAAKPHAGEKLKGRLSFLYSYHFNHEGVSYRIIYEISQKRRQVFIRLASSRENVYRKLSKMRVKPLLKRGVTR
jgi:mRNA-degrading endonuclease RelE of RelBE toxin-antitoxin system